MKCSPLIAALASILAVAPAAAHSEPAPGASGLKITQRIAGPDSRWDYASFDPLRRRVYVAGGDKVMVIDADTGKLNADFAKGDHLHAVVPVPGTDRIVTTNSGDNTAKVIDARTGALLASIPVAKDADSAAFDPATGFVVVIGGDSGEITLIDPRALKAAGSITVGGALEFLAPDGQGGVFVNVVDTNQIVHVDLKARKVLSHWPMPGCRRPTGLARVTGGRLVSACANGVAKIVSAVDGHEIASLTIGEGPDAVLYDERRGLALIPCGRAGTLAVIALGGSLANTVIDTVPTQIGARTGAVDPKSGRVWLPTAQYAPPTGTGQGPAIRPGTFEVLVLDR